MSATETETGTRAEQAERRFSRFLENVSEEGQIKADERVILLLKKLIKPKIVVPVEARIHAANAKKFRQNKLDTRLNMMTSERLNNMNKYNYEHQQEIKKQRKINSLVSI